MKVILTYGTFDILHYGHIEYLRRARMMGDLLIVGLCTDEYSYKKGKKPYYKYDERKKLLESVRYVDLVIPQDRSEQKKENIEQYGVDILVSDDCYMGKHDYLKQYCKVIYLDRTPEISTSKIKRDFKIYDTSKIE